MNRTCRQCSAPFEITPDDLAFYDKVSPVFAGKKELIPPPTLCSDCRMQRRLAFRNERSLYKRHCSLTGEAIIAAYPSDSPLSVYSNAAWWSDVWDPLSYGFRPDFSQSMHVQMKELLHTSPCICLLNANSQNSEYTLNATWNKDCYMLFCASYNESCLYCYWLQRSDYCVDCSGVRESEWCYDSLDCFHSHRLFFSQNCVNCSDSRFLADCTGCNDCVGCVGLRNAQYYWLNEKLDRDTYEERLASLQNHPSEHREMADAFVQLKLRFPHPWSQQRMTEHCTGDYIYESQNCRACFDAREAQDCVYCQHVVECKESMDTSFFGIPGELLYECNNNGIGAYHNLFCSYGYGSKDCLYCTNTHFCDSCFGCANLHHKQYCILNKQYSKEEYEALVSKIIEKMREDGEWGEFFPVTMSPFAYNETAAQEYFPMTKDAVLVRGWKWRDQTDEMPKVDKIIPAAQLPDSIDDIPDDILNWAIECDATKRPFKIIKQELAFYRTMRLPVPRLHPDERHKRRMALRNPRKLWKRECMKCGKDIETSYSPERPEIVYCENCYLQTVY